MLILILYLFFDINKLVINMSTKSFKIKDIFADHWDAFVAEGYLIRSAVHKNVEKIINCGNPSMGHALYFCDHCGKFKHVPFTCKNRFCNSCGAKYTQDRAVSISSKLIRCNHRHVVFTIPEELRIFFRKDRSLLHLLFSASADTIFKYFYRLNKSENFKPGFVSTLNTVKYVIRYTGRLAMAQSRIIDYDGKFVTFYYDRHEDNKRVTEKVHAFEFIKRLIIHIPDEQFKMIRYYGLYAKKYKHSSKLYLLENIAKTNFRKKYSDWRSRLLLSFGIDPLWCSCGHTMELVGIFKSGKNLFIDNHNSHVYNSA